MEMATLECPVCYGNSVSIVGTNSDGRELNIILACACSAQFVYQYLRQGGSTLFQVRLVEQQA